MLRQACAGEVEAQGISCETKKMLDQLPVVGNNLASLTRGGAVWQLVGLITRRSQVQVLPPQPANYLGQFNLVK